MTTATPRTLLELQDRRAALTGELAAARTGLDAARQGLVDGRIQASQVVSSQTLTTTLEAALATLDGLIREAAAQEARERAQAAREAALAQLVAIAAEATEHRQQLLGLTQQALDALEPLFEQMGDHITNWAACRAAWVRGATALAPGLKQSYTYSVAVPGESEQVELLLAYLDAQGSTTAARTRVLSLTPETRRDDVQTLGLADDDLARRVFAAFRSYYLRRSGNHLEL